MDSEATSIYNSTQVIDSVDIPGSIAPRISCIECCGSRMFVGTKEGFLVEYFITDDKSDATYTRVRHVELNKGEAINFIRAASAIDCLLILHGKSVTVFSMQTLAPWSQGSILIPNVNAIAVDENPLTGDPFAVEFCVSLKASIKLGQVTVKGLSMGRNISLDFMALSVTMESGLVCAALANGYYIMLNTLVKNSKPLQLCNFDTEEKPQTIHVNKEEFLVLGPNGLGVFVTKNGSSERPPLLWPEKVSEIVVHDQLNVIAIGQNSLYVHSLVDYQTCHTIPYKGLLKCLALSEGNLYLACSKSLLKLIPISIEDRIEALLATDQIEKAFSLLNLSHLKAEDKLRLENRIHGKAVFAYLAEMDFTSVQSSLRISNMDIREVVSLFPALLPKSSTFKRACPAYHRFTNIQQLTGNNVDKERRVGSFLAALLVESDQLPFSKDLVTTAFKLSALYEYTLFLNLLKTLHNLPVDHEDLLTWLTTHKLFNAAAKFHLTTGQEEKAIDLWISILEGTLECSDYFPGMSEIVDTLVEIDDAYIVWKAFGKLAVLNAELAVQIFTRKSINTHFPPLRVAEKLKQWPDLCVTYLEDCIERKDIQDEECHTYLATLYIDNAIGEGNSDIWRLKLRDFIIHSNCLKLQFLIGRLTHTHLRQELAILHGKAGNHKSALEVFTKELVDHNLARKYCTGLPEKEERHKAFLILLHIYLDSLTSEGYEHHIVSLLTDFGDEFDPIPILAMLPDEWSLQLVSTVLFRAIRSSIHRKRQSQLIAGLTRRLNTDYQLKYHSRNHGYIVDSESICKVCHKPFDLTDPIYSTQETVVHDKCK